MLIRENTFKDWLFTRYSKEMLIDLSRDGANIGFPGLSYFKETCALYDKFKQEIWKVLCDESESLGYKNVFEMMAGFGCNDGVLTCDEFENLMVWCAAESLAHQAVGEA